MHEWPSTYYRGRPSSSSSSSSPSRSLVRRHFAAFAGLSGRSGSHALSSLSHRYYRCIYIFRRVVYFCVSHIDPPDPPAKRERKREFIDPCSLRTTPLRWRFKIPLIPRSRALFSYDSSPRAFRSRWTRLFIRIQDVSVVSFLIHSFDKSLFNSKECNEYNIGLYKTSTIFQIRIIFHLNLKSGKFKAYFRLFIIRGKNF